MKKILVLFIVFVFALSCAACGHSEASGESEASGSLADEESPEDEAQSSAASEADDKLVTGTVVYYDGATLAICSFDNMNLNFLVADNDIDKSETHGLEAGSEADVYYTGEINGNNTAAARVTRLVQSLEQSEVSADLNVTGGIIASADDTALSIISFDGEVLTFSIADDAIDMEHTDGLTAGDYVTVFYKGEIKDSNAESVNVVKVVQ